MNKNNTTKCAICFDPVHMHTLHDATTFKTKMQRPIAVLACGHCFHLDCIGNSFNAKRAMECPCCRDTQEGEWHTPRTPRGNTNPGNVNTGDDNQPVDLFVSIQRAVLFRELLSLRRSNIEDVNQISLVARRLIPNRNSNNNNTEGSANNNNSDNNSNPNHIDDRSTNTNHRRRVSVPQSLTSSGNSNNNVATRIPLTPRRRRPRRARSLSIDAIHSNSNGNSSINNRNNNYHNTSRNRRRRFHRRIRTVSDSAAMEEERGTRNNDNNNTTTTITTTTTNNNNSTREENLSPPSPTSSSSSSSSTSSRRRRPTIQTDFNNSNDAVYSMIDLPSTPVIKRVVSLAKAEMRLLQVEILQREQELRVTSSISINSNVHQNNTSPILSSPRNAANISRKIETDISRRREFLSQALGTFRCSAIMMENVGQVSQEEVDATTLFLKRHIVSAQKELRGLHQSEASREAALLRRIGVLREMEKYLEKFPRHSISPLVSPSSTSTISEEENLRNNENMLIDEDDDGLIDGEYGSIRVC